MSDNTRVDVSGGFSGPSSKKSSRTNNFFKPDQVQSMIKKFGFVLNWEGMENLSGNMSHLESQGLESKEMEISTLMAIIEFMQKSGENFLNYFLSKGGTRADLIVGGKIIESTFGSSLTISYDVQRAQLRKTNDKNVNAQVENVQNSTMKKDIEVVQTGYHHTITSDTHYLETNFKIFENGIYKSDSSSTQPWSEVGK